MIVNYDNAKFTFTQNFKIGRNFTISFNLKGYTSFRKEMYNSLKINLHKDKFVQDRDVSEYKSNDVNQTVENDDYREID